MKETNFRLKNLLWHGRLLRSPTVDVKETNFRLKNREQYKERAGVAFPFGGATSQLHLYRFLSISLSFFSPQKVLV